MNNSVDSKNSNEVNVDEIKKRINMKKVINIITGVIILICGIYSILSLTYFKDVFLPNTYINGIKCSYLNSEEAIAQLNKAISGYELTITDNDTINEIINANEIDLTYSIEEQINRTLKMQNSWLWGLNLINRNDIILEQLVVFNEEKLLNKINSFNFVINSGKNVSENAKIVYDGEQYIIEAGKHGDIVQLNVLDSVVSGAILSLQNNVDLVENECFLPAAYNEKSETVIKACETANSYIKSNLTVDLGEENENIKINKSKIAEWLCIDNSYNVFFDREKIKSFVEEYASKFNTYGKTRQFLTAHGVREQVEGGDFGWLIDNDKEIDDIVRAIKAGESGTRQPICKVTGVGHGEDDWGNSYVEVDLTNQHMYVWLNGERVMDADVVTGTPIPSRVTPPGTYRIKNKMKNAVLVGDNYRTPVSYWMPFNRGIGFHDAVWQRSFGGTRYKNGYGSHGCVNLSLKVAKQLYEYVYIGMPVICYHTSAVGIAPLTTTVSETSTETTTIAKTTQKTTATSQATTQKPVTTTMVTTQTTTVVTTVQTTEVSTEITTALQQITTQPTTTQPVNTEVIITEPTVEMPEIVEPVVEATTDAVDDKNKTVIATQ